MRDDGGFIRLAQVPPFRWGAALVDPPRRRVSCGGREALLEPRIMQVLVVLAEARGAVISRDELIERCWGGRIVGENAINRVISRIRQLAAELGTDDIQLETITKVGYRMIVPESVEAPTPWPEGSERKPVRLDPPPKRWRRRNVLTGAGAVAVLAATGIWLTRPRGHVPHPEAVELHNRAQIAQRQGSGDQVRQAIAFFTRATEIDPLFAAAWGGLALSYRHVLEGFAEEQEGLPAMIESAARRALALDPDNADAKVALAIVRPYYRNWGRMEPELARLVDEHPRHWFALAQLGLVRYETGRWREGLPYTERELAVEPYIPVPHAVRARALWSLGRLQEAEAVLDAAVRRWPANYMLWNAKFTFLLFAGRPDSAAAFVMEPSSWPENLRPNAIQSRLTLIRAAESRAPADIAASIADLRGQAAIVGSTPNVVPFFLLLGRADLAHEAMDRYFFGTAGEFGPAVPPPGPFERRYTAFLFMPNMAPLRHERRFADLLGRIGLERYWRESGTLPDYRREG